MKKTNKSKNQNKNNTLQKKLEKDKAVHLLPNGKPSCAELVKLAEQGLQGKLFKICKDIFFPFLLYLAINAIVIIGISRLSFQFPNPLIHAIIISIIATYTTLAFIDGCCLYFRNMRHNEENRKDFYTGFCCFKLEFLKAVWLSLIYWTFLYISIFIYNPTGKIIFVVFRYLVILWQTLVLYLSIFYCIDNKDKSVLYCLKKSIKIMNANFFYVLGAIIYSTIKYFVFFVGLTVAVAFIIGFFSLVCWSIFNISSSVTFMPGFAIFMIPVFIVGFVWSCKINAIYSVVYELTREKK